MLVTIFLKAKNVFAPIQSPQKMVLVQCVRLHLGIKTVSCRSVSMDDERR